MRFAIEYGDYEQTRVYPNQSGYTDNLIFILYIF
jgi:hypothetical protein